jgi:hypothetical protein
MAAGMAPAYGPNITLPTQGQYGNLILSKLPLLSASNTALTQIKPGGEPSRGR